MAEIVSEMEKAPEAFLKLALDEQEVREHGQKGYAEAGSGMAGRPDRAEEKHSESDGDDRHRDHFGK